jgi:hypothetical protein
MDCEQAREWSGAALLGEAPEHPPPAVRAHLDGCAVCRREVEDARVAWRALRDLPALPERATGDREAVLVSAMQGVTVNQRGGIVSERRAGWARAAIVVLALGIGAGLGWTAGRSGAGLPAAVGEGQALSAPSADGGSGAPDVAQYLLLIRETPATLELEARVGTATLVEEYSAWAGSLAQAGSLVGAEKLTDAGAAVSGDGEEAVRSSVVGAVSGYFLVRAPDEAAALAIARESPHVKYGGVVEVRMIERTRSGT